jgi:predicted acetylornithine/succinylornithine family transaminase
MMDFMSSIATAEPEAVSASSSPSVMDLEREYLVQNYARYPLIISRGKGPWVYDESGKKYLDFISGIGVNALGHAHPRIVKVIKEQAARIIHTSNLYYNEYQGPLAKRIAQMSGLQRSFFCNSGTEAIEGALKMIRAHGNRTAPGKQEIIALDNSFHGRTLGAISVTGQPKYRRDFEPLLPGVRFVSGFDPAVLEEAVSENTAGIVLEWIQGEGGVNPIGDEFARKARELADRHNALLVFDEIQCGVGRPGTYFGYQLADPVVLPDVMVAAKPLACGLPLGVITANEKAASAIGAGMHGSTFGGGAMACRVALEFFDILDELMPSIRSTGEYFREQLRTLGTKFGFIREVRGYGLMIGLQLDIPGKQFVLDAMREGLLINCTHDTVLRFLPPYIVTNKDVDRAVKVLSKIFAGYKPQSE